MYLTVSADLQTEGSLQHFIAFTRLHIVTLCEMFQFEYWIFHNNPIQPYNKNQIQKFGNAGNKTNGHPYCNFFFMCNKCFFFSSYISREIKIMKSYNFKYFQKQNEACLPPWLMIFSLNILSLLSWKHSGFHRYCKRC